MSRETYAQREAKTKRLRAAKNRAVSKASDAVEELWKMCADHESGFTEQEKQAVANASHQLRSITGGWVNYRKVRL
jgi:hypothetical protein